jgi:hypothetical protein
VGSAKPQAVSIDIHRQFFILHPSSFILHPSSFILHPSSFILHPSSFILHPSSFILHPSALPPSSFPPTAYQLPEPRTDGHHARHGPIGRGARTPLQEIAPFLIRYNIIE